MNGTHFDLKFDECGHVFKVPHGHSADHVWCFECSELLKETPWPGLCPNCNALGDGRIVRPLTPY
jgi:hypothetical protein